MWLRKFFIFLPALCLTGTPLAAQNEIPSNSGAWSLVVPFGYVKTSLSSDGSLHRYISSHGKGPSWKAGMGLKHKLLPELAWRFEILTWKTRFNALTFDTVGVTVYQNEEKGQLSFTGFGTRCQIEKEYYHFALGIDVAIDTRYRADHISTDPSTGAVNREYGTHYSRAADTFENQVSVVFATGFHIHATEQLKLNPVFEFSAPLRPLFHSGFYTDDPIIEYRKEMNIRAFLLQFGVVIEFALNNS